MTLKLDSLTVDTLAETPLADLVGQLVAREPEAFRERLAQVDMAELSEIPDDIAQSYGWRGPDELVAWRSVELGLDLDLDMRPEAYWKSNDLTLELDLYPDALMPSEEELARGDFLPASAEVLFAGLFKLCEHASGDRTLVSLLPDPLGLMRVHTYDHDNGRLGEARSLKRFLLTTWLSEMDPDEGPRRPGQVGIARYDELRRIAAAFDERQESVRRDHLKPGTLDSAKLYARSRWLIDLLWGSASVSLAEELAQSPDLSDWAAEKSLLRESPWLAHYWMTAHYFLGNDAACAEALARGVREDVQSTGWVAELIRGLLENPSTARIRRTGARELAELRRQVRAAARPQQLETRSP